MSETCEIQGIEVRIRPVEVTDVDGLARMALRLSPETIYLRFFAPLPRVPRSHLQRVADVDHRERDALVALAGDEIVAVASYEGRAEAGASTNDAELAVTVEDAWQHRGLGLLLARRLANVARGRGCRTFVATILPDNRAALDLMRKLAPDADIHFSDGSYVARLPLAS